MNNVIRTTVLLAAIAVSSSAWAGDSGHDESVMKLACVQYSPSGVSHKSDKIYLECVKTKKEKKSNHKYHEESDNPFD